MEDLYDFKSTVLTSEVELSEIDKTIFKNFDFDFDGKTEFTIPHFSRVTEDFNIGVIYGSSGSGGDQSGGYGFYSSTDSHPQQQQYQQYHQQNTHMI